MICYARQSNLLKPSGGISGESPSCIAAPVGFLFGGSSMKRIPLTQGKVALVDDEDYDYLMQWKWCAQKCYNVYYAVRHYGHPTLKNSKGWAKQITVRMHQLILHIPQGFEIDHINHDGLDNRRCNLRVCTASENRHNQRPRKDGLSKYKGVYMSRGKWTASISCANHRRCVGRFVSEIEAATAYDEKARELFGEFAYTNFKE